MKLPSSKLSIRVGGGLLASLLLALFFQNCGKAGFDAQLDEQSMSSSASNASLVAKYGEALAAKVEAIPFSFEASFDTITYNSCAESQLKSAPGFFTLKAGAYADGGIRIKDDYFNYADATFKPIYPETRLTEDQYKEYLADAPANAKISPNMAIRVKNSLSDVFALNKSVTLGSDVVPMVGVLTDPLVMDAYGSYGTTAKYFPFSPEQKTMEATWTYNDNETYASYVRNQIFMNSGMLALTFMKEGEDVNMIRSPASAYPYRTAYGKGYSLTFAPKPGAASNPSRILAQVLESDLSSPGKGIRQWNCSRQYYVISTIDQNNFPTLCPSHTIDEIQGSATIRAELAIARRHLRADQWDVNVIKRCVVPKSGTSCYKEQQVSGAPVVEYDMNRECFRTDKSDYLSGVPNSACMHFITMCTAN